MTVRFLIITLFLFFSILSIVTVYYRYIVLEDFSYETKDITEFTESDL